MVVVRDLADGAHRARLVGRAQRADTLAGARLPPILVHAGPLAVALSRYRQNGGLLVEDFERDHLVPPFKEDAPHADRCAAGRADLVFGEPHRLAVPRREQDVLAAVGRPHVDDRVVGAQVQGDDAVAAHVGVRHEFGLLDLPAAGRKDEKPPVLKLPYRQKRRNLLALGQRQQIDQRLALGRPAALRHLVHPDAIDLPDRRKEQQEVVRGRDEHVLDEVFFAGRRPHDAFAPAALRAVLLHRVPLNVAGVGDGDHDVFLDDQVRVRRVAAVRQNFRPPGVAEPFAHVDQFLPDDPVDLARAGQNALQFGDGRLGFGVLGQDLLAFELRQPLQPHVQNSLRLRRTQPEAVHQRLPHVGRIAARAHDGQHRVQIVECDLEPLQQVQAFLRFLQVEGGAAADDFAPMLQKVHQHGLERQQPRLPIDDGQQDDAERLLQLGHFVELIQDHFRHAVAFEIDHDAHAVAVRLVAQVRNAGNPLFVDQFGDPFDQLGLVHLERDGVHDDGRPARLFVFLDGRGGPHGDHAAAGLVRGAHPGAAVDERAGREIRTRYVLHQLRGAERVVLDQGQQRGDDLAEIVGRDVRRHADRDAGRAVHQQVGKLAGQDGRLPAGVVVVGNEVDGLPVDVREQFRGDARHAHLGVAHGRGRVAVHRAEIALAIDQRVAQRKVLRHADQRIVHRGVAVRVIFADHVADHAGRLLVRPVPVVAEILHGVQHAPMHGLEAVAHVRQGAADDDAHRVVHVGLPHFLLDVDRRQGAGSGRVCHDGQGFRIVDFGLWIGRKKGEREKSLWSTRGTPSIRPPVGVCPIAGPQSTIHNRKSTIPRRPGSSRPARYPR